MSTSPPGYEHLIVSINWLGIQYSDKPTVEFRAHCEQLWRGDMPGIHNTVEQFGTRESGRQL